MIPPKSESEDNPAKAALSLTVPGWERLQFKNDPEDIHSFNKLVGTRFLGGSGNAFLKPLFGDQSAFTLDGTKHRLARKLISQTVNSSNVEKTEQLLPHILDLEFEHKEAGDTLNVGHLMRRVTLRAMCLTILGEDDGRLFEKIFPKLESTTGYLANLVSYNKRFWEPRGRLSIGAEVRRRKLDIDGCIYSLIAERRRSLGQRSADRPIQNDLLTHLLSRQDEYDLSDQFVRDNLVATLTAGYDTTGSALTWMLFWLSNQTASRNDLSRLYVEDRATYDRHAQAFICEVMRYCPPLEILPRRPAALVEKQDLSRLDGPSLYCPCPHQVHHSAAIYGDPTEFRPARFLNQNFGPTEYFPYGLGNRLCLGVVLAPRIMKATLDWFMNSKQYCHFHTAAFRPVRRNVSLWPSFRTKAKLRKLRASPETGTAASLA